MPPEIDLEKCNLCEICDEICPGDIIHMEDKGPVVKYPDECWHCGNCRLECPTQAITIKFPKQMLL